MCHSISLLFPIHGYGAKHNIDIWQDSREKQILSFCYDRCNFSFMMLINIYQVSQLWRGMYYVIILCLVHRRNINKSKMWCGRSKTISWNPKLNQYEKWKIHTRTLFQDKMLHWEQERKPVFFRKVMLDL